MIEKDMTFDEKLKFLREQIYHTLAPLISKKCILLDLPYYTNIGDILIWEGTEHFLKLIGCKCLYRTSVDNYRYNEIPTDVTVLLQGGGNFGDIWRRHQDFRLKIIEDYPNNSIIILPQTIYYENEEIMKRDAELMKKHRNLTICVRDTKSYQLLKKYFSNNSLFLLPDMAFFMSRKMIIKFRKTEKDRILFLMRTDKEIKVADTVCPPGNVDIRDWPSIGKTSLIVSAYYKFDYLNKYFNHHLDSIIDFYAQYILKIHLVKIGVSFVSSYRYIYTTRLHVAILSTLLCKPYVFIDNSYGKNRTFYDTWLSDLSDVKFEEK